MGNHKKRRRKRKEKIRRGEAVDALKKAHSHAGKAIAWKSKRKLKIHKIKRNVKPGELSWSSEPKEKNGKNVGEL